MTIKKRKVVFDLSMRKPFTVKMELNETALIRKVATTLGIPYSRVMLKRGEFWSFSRGLGASCDLLGRFDIK